MLTIGVVELIDIFQNFKTQWYWLVIATLYTITINETFTHRICSHNLFKVNVDSWTYKVLTLLSSVDQAHGPVRGCAIGHPAHHIWSDQGKRDPSNVREFWLGIACAMPFRGWQFASAEIPEPKKYLELAYNKFSHIINDPWTIFCEKHAVLISLSTLTILYFVLPTFLFKVVLTGRVLLVVMFFLIGLCHSRNIPLTYRHVNTPDNSNNNLVFHYLFLGIFGGFLQNNHHSHPNRMNMGRTWYELDTSTPIAYILKFLMEKK